MFNTIKGFILGFVAGCLVLGGYAYTHHVVRTADGFKCVPKAEYSLDKIYVDARSWGPMDFITNRDVVQALATAGYQQTKAQAQESLKSNRESLEKALQDARREAEEKLKLVR